MLTTKENKSEVVHLSSSILCDDPRTVYFSILNKFFAKQKQYWNSSLPTAQKHELLKLMNIYIDDSVELSANVTLYPNITFLGNINIGEGSIIGPGTVIGFEGFGYIIDKKGNYERIIHQGGVTIGENSDIGANVCIDSGTLYDTVIGNNVKIDDLVHIGHNAVVRDNAMITSHTNLGGSVLINENVYISPSSSITNKISIGSNSFVRLGAVVISDVENNTKVFGNPARTIK